MYTFLSRACEGRIPLWISLDKKCDPGCWYCKDLCHNCMKPANFGYAKTSENIVYKHCSERCYSLHFGKPSEAPFQGDLVCINVNKPLVNTIHLQATQVVETDLSVNTVFHINLCLSCNHPKVPNGVPYILLQVRSTKKYIFLSFFVSHDMCPEKPLWYISKLQSETGKQMAGFVQEALKTSLAKKNILDFNSILM